MKGILSAMRSRQLAAALARSRMGRPWHFAAFLRNMLAVLLLIGLFGAGAQAGAANQAGLVVVHGDDSVVTRCVDFVEPQISGIELLQRSGVDLDLEASSIGATICRIDGEGCSFPQQGCFCQCEGATCVYWSYWRWESNAWRYSQQGASNSSVLPGSVEGWVWGAGAVDSAQPPPAITMADICAAPTPTPSSTPTPAAIASATRAPDMSTATPTVAAATTTAPTPTPTLTLIPPVVPAAVPVSTPLPASPMPTPTPVPTWTAPPTLSPATATPHAAASAPLIEYLAADRQEITAGETFTLVWSTRNASLVQLQAEGRAVEVLAAGSLLLAPRQNTTYSLVAAGAEGVTSAAGITIIVRPPGSAISGEELLAESATDSPGLLVPEPRPSEAEPIIESPLASPTPHERPTVTVAPIALALSPTATLAPVVISTTVVAPQPGAGPALATAALPALDTGGTLSMLIGFTVLAGIPLLILATVLAVWLLRHAW